MLATIIAGIVIGMFAYCAITILLLVLGMRTKIGTHIAVKMAKGYYKWCMKITDTILKEDLKEDEPEEETVKTNEDIHLV
jgi:hypothetical protein